MANEYIRFVPEDGCPYSDVVVVDGEFLFLSGLVSEDMDSGELVTGDITVQTRQVLSNLKRILEQYGSDMSHVIRAEVLLSDFSERKEMNAEYAKHFPAAALPARMCYGGVDLADGCKIEVMVIAKKAN